MFQRHSWMCEAATNFDAKLQRRRKQITTGWKNLSATKLNSPTSTMSEPAWKGFLHCIVLHIFPKHVQTLLHYTSSFAGCMRFLYCCLEKTCNWRLEVLVAHNDQKQTSKLQAICVLPLIMLHPSLEVKELMLLLVSGKRIDIGHCCYSLAYGYFMLLFCGGPGCGHGHAHRCMVL